VSDWDDQGMPQRHGVRIPDDDAELVAGNDALGWQFAERASHFRSDQTVDESRNTVHPALSMPSAVD